MRIPSAAIFIGILAITGCAGDVASLSSASLGSPTPSSALGASAAPSSDPVPSAQVGTFSCDLPVVTDATTALANITDVRVGTHSDHDRVVFEFADGLPEVTLDRATPPFTHDASGLPIEVDGASFLRLTMRGGTKQTADGTSSYEGPTDLDPAYPMLVDLVEGGDFEAQSTWYLGLAAEACVRVIQLTDDGTARLVIDVEH
ncbi:MAG: hypothetical protein M3406_00700 [Chloroflexota bacterium]|nr:hypothetical protein [Chloroflexota bacterium]